MVRPRRVVAVVVLFFVPGSRFTLIYWLLRAFGAKALGYGRRWAVGVLFGLLGWLTEHFTFTYLEGDSRPGGPRRGEHLTARSEGIRPMQ